MSQLIDSSAAPPTSPSRTTPWHALPAETVVQQLRGNLHDGLSSADIERRRQQAGWNSLEEAPPEPMWKKFLHQFQDLVIWILIAASILSGVLGEWGDTAAILAIVLVNGLVGFFQEERASQALATLMKLSSPMAKVIRDGTLQSVPAKDLVPGDRIELEAGDNLPADVRLTTSFGLRVQEAALTGESVPVDKDAAAAVVEAAALGDRSNMGYAGTVVAAGKASAVVVETGMRTELGRIAGLLDRVERVPTPLQRRLHELGKILVAVCLGIVGVIFVLEISRGKPVLEVLMVSVSLAVAAVPEGLPAVVTLALAIGLQRMVQRNALVRRLPSVETLGSVTVICTDKTGTLTRNEMTVREIVTARNRYHVTGSGYAPQGQFLRRTEEAAAPTEALDLQDDADFQELLTIASRCNNASVSPRGERGAWQVIGDPTEGALIVAAMKAKIDAKVASEHVLYEIPFDSDRKRMSVVVRIAGQPLMMYTKGAPESVLGCCLHEFSAGQRVPLSDERRQAIMQHNAELARQALRVLAFAVRELPAHSVDEYEERDLVFVGLVGMIDPPREEAREAVQTCHAAGIRPVMITGDHPETALAIAKELQLAKGSDGVVTGSQLDSLSEEQLQASLEQTAVFARVSAEHKLRIVTAWKRHGDIVAMTGDGVNDAPAVEAADIGIAMGITGTDVTREAADMVLTDDNFRSIVGAVEEGRGIFDNIRKVVHYLLSCNAAEVMFMFFAAVVGWPAPLLAIQILWINLVTDSLPALALGVEPPESDIMTRAPRPPREPVITRDGGWLMFFHGLLVAVVAAIGFGLVFQGVEAQLQRAQTVAFCVLAFSQLGLAFSCRSHRYTMPELGMFTNPSLLAGIAVSALLQLSVVMLPFAQPLFQTTGQLAGDWTLVFVLSLAPVTIIEFVKLGRTALRSRRAVSAGHSRNVPSVTH